MTGFQSLIHVKGSSLKAPVPSNRISDGGHIDNIIIVITLINTNDLHRNNQDSNNDNDDYDRIK